MIEFDHRYTLSSEWHNDLAQKMGAAVYNDRLMQMPESIGKGHSFFLEVIPGLSVLFLDFILSAPIRLKRLSDQEDLRIVHFDLSENGSKITEPMPKAECNANSGLAVISTGIENTHVHAAGKRVFSLRLIVDKMLLASLTDGSSSAENALSKSKFGDKRLCFCDYIDSNSKILIHSIRKKPVLGNAFEFFLRGAALMLLANLGVRYAAGTPAMERQDIKKKDFEAFNAAKNYLLDNLRGSFPGLACLSAMAMMSATKYKTLFHIIENTSPNVFFEKNKIALAEQMVKSGSYLSLEEIVFELNYKRLESLEKNYYNSFGRKVSEDFIGRKGTV